MPWHIFFEDRSMALTLYKQKRSFEKTPEPTGGTSTEDNLRFVIQKHAASRLHYDFRLEMKGVLKSWAVPKGPSTDPSVKRLAMMVEDHPFDYRDFEGIIPKGNYGAGTVIVWDEGTYEPVNKMGDKKAQEKELLKELYAGAIKFVLHGKKLKGEFALVRTKGGEENAWLLIKHNDRFASEKDISLKDKSVISGKTLEKVAITSDNIYGRKTIDLTRGNKSAPVKEAEKSTRKKPATVSTVKQESGINLTEAPKAPFPKTLAPMLATLVDKPFDEPGWLYEIKWDGYRAIALCNKGKVELKSRNNKSFNEKFYPVYDAIKQWNINAVLDGEIAVLNKDGISHFGALQNWRSEADGDLVFYVFDILWLDGHILTNLPLTKRRDYLRSILPDEGIIRLSEDFKTSAPEFLELAGKIGLEGIIAKKEDSIYHPGIRSREWLKIKVNKRHEVIIGGFTNNDGSAKTFSSLLVGVKENGKLRYTGKIGTGFSEKLQKEMMARFKPFITDKIPFESVPDINKPSRFRPNPPNAKATWLKPKLVCEVSYTEMTDDGVMRHPSFEGMRVDKDAKDVHEEIPESTEKVVRKKGRSKTATETKKVDTGKLLTPAKDKERKTLLNPTDETQVRKVNGHELKFSNLSKIFWPAEKYTKRELLNYYYQVAPYILPYLKDRPQSLNRFPNGINGKSFYQKDVTGKVPDWIDTFPYHTSDEKDKNFMICNDEASLLYMVNLGSIEINPWNSTIQKPENPDWCILDLDPDTGNSFEQVIQTAQKVKELLDAIHVEGFCKTSGSTGIHIYIPLGAKYSYDECQLFGKLIATHVHHELPRFTSIERLTNKRSGKLYIDYLQNRPKATLAAPYSARPKPGATVSMPLHWEEVKKGLKMKHFNIKNAINRIKEEGDIFKGVLGKGADIKKAVSKLNEL